jgi:glucose-1-phosphate cytidylyltransferase
VKNDDAFCFTYGDGLSDLNISSTIEFHRSHKKLATITATYPPGRFGALTVSDKQVKGFIEKPQGDGGMINGGYFVLSPKSFGLIESDNTTWEDEPLNELSKTGQLMAYEHKGFWQPMDTLRDKQKLQKLWAEGNAPWRQWS